MLTIQPENSVQSKQFPSKIFEEAKVNETISPSSVTVEVVRLAGLEPARVTPLPPQSSVSANSTISATALNEAVHPALRKWILGRIELVSFFLLTRDCCIDAVWVPVCPTGASPTGSNRE
jgi:hypothetical protein